MRSTLKSSVLSNWVLFDVKFSGVTLDGEDKIVEQRIQEDFFWHIHREKNMVEDDLSEELGFLSNFNP